MIVKFTSYDVLAEMEQFFAKSQDGWSMLHHMTEWFDQREREAEKEHRRYLETYFDEVKK